MSYLIVSCLGLLFLLIAVLPYCQQKKRQLRVRRWQHSLNLPQHLVVFNQLYHNVNGFLLSEQTRQQQGDSIDYVYGEIEFIPFIALLSLVNWDEETVFYDLGSGTGKAVFACAMVYPARHYVGVELFPALHDTACNLIKQLAAKKNYRHTATKIAFILGDFFAVDLNEATLIFINATALFGESWEKISGRMDNIPYLNTVITTSKPLLSTKFYPILTTKVAMSWGVVVAYIHRRKTNLD